MTIIKAYHVHVYFANSFSYAFSIDGTSKKQVEKLAKEMGETMNNLVVSHYKAIGLRYNNEQISVIVTLR